MSVQQTVTQTVKGIASVRKRQRQTIKYAKDANPLKNEVILRVPIEEVTDEVLGASEDRPVSYPKYWQEMTTRHYEHYNVRPTASGGAEAKLAGIWCETILSKDEADAIIKAHPDAMILDEKDDLVV